MHSSWNSKGGGGGAGGLSSCFVAFFDQIEKWGGGWGHEVHPFFSLPLECIYDAIVFFKQSLKYENEFQSLFFHLKGLFLPVVWDVLTLRSDFEPEIDRRVDREDDQEGKNELDEAGRHVVSPPETRKGFEDRKSRRLRQRVKCWLSVCYGMFARACLPGHVCQGMFATACLLCLVCSEVMYRDTNKKNQCWRLNKII